MLCDCACVTPATGALFASLWSVRGTGQRSEAFGDVIGEGNVTVSVVVQPLNCGGVHGEWKRARQDDPILAG